MRAIKSILNRIIPNDASEKYNRHYRLIRYISAELVIVCSLIICLYSVAKLWYLVLLISSAMTLTLLNFLTLLRTKNTIFCGHAIILITFITITLANYLVWGIGPLHSQWFYVMPLLAASLTDRAGMLFYSACSLFLVLGFSKFSIPPYYAIPEHKLIIIESINHLFSYVIIVTTLLSLLYENKRFEQKLNDKNYLLQAEKDKYHYLARFDQLTNLPNRRYFKQHLYEIVDSLANNYSATVFFLDIDNFKYINDRYGHNVGDHLLFETSRRLQDCFRQGDFIARLGGDEFTAIVLHPHNEQIPQMIAKKIIHEFARPFISENIEYTSSISIGLATYPDNAQNATELLVKADRAMYVAKKVNGSAYSDATELAM